jgi:hypothetical protein
MTQSHNSKSINQLKLIIEYLEKDPTAYIEKTETSMVSGVTTYYLCCQEGSPLLEGKDLKLDFLRRAGYVTKLEEAHGKWPNLVGPIELQIYRNVKIHSAFHPVWTKVQKLEGMRSKAGEYKTRLTLRGYVEKDDTHILRLSCNQELAKLLIAFEGASRIPGSFEEAQLNIIYTHDEDSPKAPRMEVGHE